MNSRTDRFGSPSYISLCRKPADDRCPPSVETDIDDAVLEGRVLTNNGYSTSVEGTFNC